MVGDDICVFSLQSDRTERVDSWRSFQISKSKKKGKSSFKPPKLKQEQRIEYSLTCTANLNTHTSFFSVVFVWLL